ncbi:glutaredoxin family protein [Microbacterium oleivorans]|uniref:Glutaredoxin family protein n=1 Tax=Microbacterium oleivorans TaxID=273677 RepID=A0A7D5IVL3_9MICO|nr:glutaredoxin family protein [Microbacterium oleivorans]QLD11262.1 glutaredoxin family protein [Microbacterium oleivorans]
MTTLTLVSKPDCHLCDVAREIVDTVVADLPDGEVDVTEVSILDDAALYEQWWEKIPVVLIDDRLHAHWRLSADRLRAALAASLRDPAAPAASAPTEESA